MKVVYSDYKFPEEMDKKSAVSLVLFLVALMALLKVDKLVGQ